MKPINLTRINKLNPEARLTAMAEMEQIFAKITGQAVKYTMTPEAVLRIPALAEAELALRGLKAKKALLGIKVYYDQGATHETGFNVGSQGRISTFLMLRYRPHGWFLTNYIKCPTCYQQKARMGFVITPEQKELMTEYVLRDTVISYTAKNGVTTS